MNTQPNKYQIKRGPSNCYWKIIESKPTIFVYHKHSTNNSVTIRNMLPFSVIVLFCIRLHFTRHGCYCDFAAIIQISVPTKDIWENAQIYIYIYYNWSSVVISRDLIQLKTKPLYGESSSRFHHNSVQTNYIYEYVTLQT